jgi:uncharacterized protein
MIRAVLLSAREGRVIGSLIEKQLTTPQQYPLTLNALVAACNQTSNREPVAAYDDGEVLDALERLKASKLVRFVLPSHGRSVVRYRHVLDEVLGLDAPQLAVLAVLVLRGPQTGGELRIRTERMAELSSLGAVEHELDLLARREEQLVERLERRPGQKEERWRALLLDPVDEHLPTPAPVAIAGTRGGAAPLTPAPSSALGEVQAELAALREEMAELRAAVADLRQSLGG